MQDTIQKQIKQMQKLKQKKNKNIIITTAHRSR